MDAFSLIPKLAIQLRARRAALSSDLRETQGGAGESWADAGGAAGGQRSAVSGPAGLDPDSAWGTLRCCAPSRPRLRTLVALTVTAKGVGRGKIPESS